MYVNGVMPHTAIDDVDALNKWLSFNWDGHWLLARYDAKTDAMPILFQATDQCNQYKLQNKWTGEQADDMWLGYSSCGDWIQANSTEDEAATFELVKECDETLSGPSGRDYRGCQTRTTSGRTCQKWTAQTPQGHGPLREDRGVGDHNQCRNPGGKLTIWCYTTDPAVRWEFCDPLPQSEFKMRVVTQGYLSYSDKDHEAHPMRSIEGDYTEPSAMVFNLHRNCPPAPEGYEPPAIEASVNLAAKTKSESPAMQILRDNPAIVACFAGAVVLAVISGMRRSRSKKGDLYKCLVCETEENEDNA